jgi:predicted aminopeptidase
MSARRAALTAAALALLGAGGCSTVGYYYQAAAGQWELVRASRPLDAWIADPATQPALRDKLHSVREIREFAARELGLPDNDSYRSYADLRRPYVVWNVVAAAEFSTRPKEWCFPFAGCVSYKGWFHEAEAQAAGRALAAEGYDSFVYGVPAYSTLGWFSDPVLNTYIHYPRQEIARLVIHELAHQVAYVSGDSTFNESFATFVEREGVRRWLDREGSEREREAFAAMDRYKRDFLALVLGTREKLDRLYAEDLSETGKRARKAQAFAAMRADYERLKVEWGGFSGYDRWFAQALGNAHVASVATYTELVPAFEQLLHETGGDMPRFLAAVRALAEGRDTARRDRIAALLEAAGHGQGAAR